MAALGLMNHLQSLWPFSAFKLDDLKESDKLVKKLSIPEHTKEFVFAIQDHQTGSVVYILSAQNLSERSARDVEYLIEEVCPDAVFVQTGPALQEFEQMYEGSNEDSVPTSAFGVLKRCFTNRIGKDEYDYIAGNLVLREIFGVGSFRHLVTAKMAAMKVGSSFFTLESSRVNPGSDRANNSSETGLCSNSIFLAVGFQSGGGSSVKSLRSNVLSNLKGHFTASNIPSDPLKPLSIYVDLSLADVGSSGSSVDNIEPQNDYEPPPFAQSIYPLLLDLYDIFGDIPSIGRALAYAQKLFHDVGRGKNVNAQILTETHTFQIAVEGLRVAMNKAGRLPMNKIRNSGSEITQFSDLLPSEKSQCLIAQALRSQTRSFKTTVAVTDAVELAGIRKYWNTPVPPEVEDTLKDIVLGNNVETSEDRERKGILASKPVLALGAGATAVLGTSSLSKVVPASTFVKIITLNVPASLKIFLAQTHKTVGIITSKILGPFKVIVPGFAGSGAKGSTILNASASAGKIRAVTHTVITSAEKNSFSAMRTAFYEIMRNRKVRRVGFLPWAMFGCSITTCAGLIAYGDGIECAVESLPSAPAIASLGRGIQNLQQTSRAVGQNERTNIQKAIESLMYRFKNR